MAVVDYLTPEEVSARLGGAITVKTLANWRCDAVGKGPPFNRFGNRIRYPEPDFEKWRQEQQFATTRDYGRPRPVAA